MKRTKIALALSMCVLCLGMLAFAVYSAVTSATFNLNGTINFNPEGVYVDIEGKVLRGSSRTDLVELTGDNFTYKDRNYDDSTGETSGSFTMTSWSPEVAFLPSERFIQYQVTITNKSGEAISALPSDITVITDVTTTEEVSAVLRIEPGETKTYKLTLESTGDTAITDAQIALDFDIRTTSSYVEEQNNLGGVTFTQNNGTITAVSGDNSTSSTLSLQKALFIPETIDSTTITAYGSGSSISLSTNIKYIIFVADITSIGNNAFRTSGIRGIEIQNGVTNIGSAIFYDCVNLTSIEIPIGTTSIGSGFFTNCISLVSIEIPNGVTSIGGSAFSNCTSLTSIEIPNSVTSIGSSAFQNCSSLTSIKIPSGLTSMGDSAFQNCSSLTSIEIPSSVTSISGTTFSGCSLLQTTVSEYNENYSSDNGSLYNKAQTELIRGAGGVSTIHILDSVTTIGFYAFDSCTNLINLTIPSSVTSIGSSAFQNCSALESIEIPNGVTYITTSTFSGCTKLKSIELPTTLRQIRSNVFQNCTSLTDIEIPSSVTSIDNTAFYNCSSLQITVASDNANYSSDNGSLYNKAQTELIRGAGSSTVNILDTVTSIEDRAFNGCTNLINLTIPNSVTSIGSYVFNGCGSLQITVANDNTNYSSDNGSLYNKAQTTLIRGAGGVSTVNILDTVTSIGNYAFDSCTNLINLTIPSSVTSIGSSAFSNCTNLTSLTIPSSVTSIGYSAFSNCTNLTSLTIPSSVTSIGQYLISGCTNLTTITLNAKDGYVWQSGYSSHYWTVDVSDPVNNVTLFMNTYSAYNWRQIAA